MNSKIVPLADFKPRKNVTRVLVGGCFDILHIGHAKFLQEAKKFGNELVVALESDEFIQKRKLRKPFNTLYKRAEILTGLESVDIVVILPYLQNDDEYANLVKKIQPSVIAITAGDPQEDNKIKHAQLVGAEVKVVLQRIPGKSTTEILRQIKE
ncbi:hypothetical protein A2862_04275 [Candidatus Roizmanbacteria bacterium RIFCSPHIGHO2_01_FULL_38_41]|uniref:Cytidyltransferase-like domain-containing protein n=1 Tax=Candidatus Roizmanbacteria bacterium RIFCSPHIGHO2_02_FULL_37_24 TaxID=1802037 RepID=A0A1F7H0R0_9BACT|nr:MAG: hypothetical protein A2862_04275 [Candidatus Roizmanbacteria bacterium RIFCSPHIGHO2_01_FULL_38_41]OGK24705.1 MAG: hypothetical protein A3C24_01110 [Candidatus Roizmanbacteria bacterium RIFCSPHIGHO2_02_FULL_37_24]OGK33224.1 MAG: hypothetical protein A3E10_03710 [Candidatus Roizmanbacteria bacterium RIFCSPHIGHO2_12_FULL_37_23]OGK44096.1 MAG: hypothetical protein A2956_03535 [Candidatus Roizmanbacteria bacterium RIFCSPLOWO2_01_FULL_37_57]